MTYAFNCRTRVATANGNATITTTGDIANSGKLQAGKTLAVTANIIDNTATGDINGGTTQVTAANALVNRGAIDGVNTEINTGTLYNLGTGRIYGDHVSIAATTVHNYQEAGIAATIAARDQLDVGAQTINNSEHALIFSGGNMAIGGSLDTNRNAMGPAGTVTNASATMEALGNMVINTSQLNNTDNHFSYRMEVTSTEYNLRDDISLTLYRKYTRTTTSPVANTGDPGNILASGNITIYGQNLTNHVSHIVAGGVLTSSTAPIVNSGVDAQQSIDDVGTTYTKVQFPQTGTCGFIKYNCVRAHDDWVPSPYSASSQKTVTVSQITPQTRSGAQPPAVLAASTSAATSAVSEAVAQVNFQSFSKGPYAVDAVKKPTETVVGGAVGVNVSQTARINPITQVVLISPTGGAQVVRTTVPNTQIPNTSLFHLSPNPASGYLVETDPRFANYKTWLGSDYLLNALNIDPTTLQKRLGDAFYEQRLIREQVTKLTGQRFAGDYSTDEEQYRALMDGGVTYARAHNLRPGIALSAAQMAVLTADIVWLVEQDVTLPNGQVTRALVPQVYVRTKAGDLDGSGALLAGREVKINTKGDLLNTGTIAGRSIVSISADNVNNLGGRINGDQVAVNAKTDLNNIGGSITANSSLRATAGRDINISTTSSSSTNQASSAGASGEFSRTSIDRVAGLYVTGDKGILVASAGRDLDITAGVISNAGTDSKTILAAVNNLNLKTVTTGESNNIVWNATNRLNYGQTTDVGSLVLAGGSVRMVAGNDVNAKAATVQAQGDVIVSAARDVNVTAGKNTTQLDEAHQQTGKSLFSKTTVTTRDQVNTTESVGSSITGQNVIVLAKRDINVQGSSLNADKALALDAGQDINVTATQNTRSESHQRVEQKSATGLAKGLATVIALADPISALTPNSVNQVAIAALITRKNSSNANTLNETTAVSSELTGGTISSNSGRDTTLQAAKIVADGAIDIRAGRDLSLSTADNTTNATSANNASTYGLLQANATSNSVGARKQSQSGEQSVTSQSTTQIISLGKDQNGKDVQNASITLAAARNYQQTGGDIRALGTPSAPTAGSEGSGNISIDAQSIRIDEARTRTSSQEQTASKQTAATAQLKSGYVDAVKGAAQSIDTARTAKEKTGSNRMAALATVNAAMNVYNAATGIGQSAGSDSASAAPISAISVSSSIGVSKSNSTSSQASDTAQGANIQAAGNLSLRATGAGKDSNIRIQGANLEAGQTASLKADNNIELLAAQNTNQQQSTNSASSASMGATFALGGSQNGLSFQAGASGSRGTGNGSETTFSNTHIQAKQVNLQSGGDTTLQGAVVKADKVNADIGGNLNIESLQDTSNYQDKQTSVGGGISLCIPPICYGTTVAVNVNAAQAKIGSNYQSVAEQSAIRAGDGGFAVNVKGNTQLTGGAITSSQRAIDNQANSFQTGGTLSTSDIQNQADFKASSVSVSASYGGKASGSAGFGNESGSASSTTAASISGLAGHKEARTGDKETGIAPIFDKDKVKTSIQVQTAITASFGQNAAKAIGDVAGAKAKALKEQAAAADKAGDSTKAQELSAEAAKWEEGGAYRVALHTVAGGLTGGGAGALGAGAVATAAPTLDELQNKVEQGLINAGVNPTIAKITSQALAGSTALGIGAAASGGSAAGGATAFNTDTNNRQLHPTETQRIKALASQKAKDTCNGSADCERSANIYWADMLQSAAEGRIEQLAALTNPEIAAALASTVEKLNWVEYAVIGAPFGILGLDAAGRAGWIQLELPENLTELSEMALSQGWDADTIKDVREGQLLIDLELQQALGSVCQPRPRSAVMMGSGPTRLYACHFEVGADHSPGLKSGLSTFRAGRAERVLVD